MIFSPEGWSFIAGGGVRLRTTPPETAAFDSCRLKACSPVVTPPSPGSRPPACISIITPLSGGGGLRPSPPATHDQASGLQDTTTKPCYFPPPCHCASVVRCIPAPRPRVPPPRTRARRFRPPARLARPPVPVPRTRVPATGTRVPSVRTRVPTPRAAVREPGRAGSAPCPPPRACFSPPAAAQPMQRPPTHAHAGPEDHRCAPSPSRSATR